MSSAQRQPGLISVIIPSYNRAGTVERAIRSALDQGYASIEVLLVDDGSKDDTAQVMARLCAADSRIKYLPKPNGGVCTARNHGLLHARGEFIAMLDSDDYWLPGKLALQMPILQAHPEVSLIWSDMDAVTPDGKVVKQKYLRKMYQSYRFFPEPMDLFSRQHQTANGATYFIGDIRWAQLLGNLIHTSTVIARADRLEQAGFYDQAHNPAEDQDYYFRVCKTGSVAFVDAVTMHYTVGAEDQATSPSQAHKMSTSHLGVLTKLLKAEAGSIRMPRHIVRTALGDGNAWVGQTYFARKEYALARSHLLKAVWYRPANRYAAKLLLGTFLPESVIRGRLSN